MMMARSTLRSPLIGATLAAALVMGTGCKALKWSNQREPTRPVLELTHLVGGTHERMVQHEGLWYQAFAGSLLIIDPATGRVLSDLELGEPGTVGPVVDMVVRGDRLFVVIKDEEVVEFTLDNPLAPRVVASVSAERLEVRPRRLSLVEGELYVSGDGGVVRWSDGWVYLPGQEDVSIVAATGDDPLACSGRRVYRLRDGQFVGSASELHPLPPSFGGAGDFVFLRRAGNDGLVGLMTAEFIEVDQETATVAVRGPIRSVRLFAQQIWVVTDHAIEVFATAGDRLVRLRRIDVLGARDVAMIDENHLAVAGSFGRAVYRIDDDADGEGDTFLLAHREPSRLTRVHRRAAVIAAGSVEGVWLYTISADAEFSDLSAGSLPQAPPSLEASTVRYQARVSPDRRLVTISGGEGEQVFVESSLARIHCVESIDDAIWVGHDRGLSVLGFDETGAVQAVHELRLPGAVDRLFPLLTGGGAAFVSEFGGFGVAEIFRVPIPPEELELMTPEAIEAARRW
ncbi:MAG: hypothetical protein ACYTGG_08590 [Planctomycetota bacterium]|jgi:hypothetical protein